MQMGEIHLTDGPGHAVRYLDQWRRPAEEYMHVRALELVRPAPGAPRRLRAEVTIGKPGVAAAGDVVELEHHEVLDSLTRHLRLAGDEAALRDAPTGDRQHAQAQACQLAARLGDHGDVHATIRVDPAGWQVDPRRPTRAELHAHVSCSLRPSAWAAVRDAYLTAACDEDLTFGEADIEQVLTDIQRRRPDLLSGVHMVARLADGVRDRRLILDGPLAGVCSVLDRAALATLAATAPSRPLGAHHPSPDARQAFTATLEAEQDADAAELEVLDALRADALAAGSGLILAELQRAVGPGVSTTQIKRLLARLDAHDLLSTDPHISPDSLRYALSPKGRLGWVLVQLHRNEQRHLHDLDPVALSIPVGVRLTATLS